MTYLLIDIGNSFTKYSVYRNKVIEQVASVPTPKFEAAIKSICNSLIDIKAIVYVSVIEHDKTQLIINNLYDSFACEIKRVETQRLSFGVRCAYTHIDTLGADRWVAIIAAYQSLKKKNITQAVMVVDCGTVITADVIDSAGQHQGGWMMPGENLLTVSLSNNSNGIQKGVDSDALNIVKKNELPSIGQSTTECISAGITLSQIGFIEQCYFKTQQLLNTEPHCIITGGGAKKLIDSISIKFEFNEDLIFEGLAVFAE